MGERRFIVGDVLDDLLGRAEMRRDEWFDVYGAGGGSRAGRGAVRLCFEVSPKGRSPICAGDEAWYASRGCRYVTRGRRDVQTMAAERGAVRPQRGRCLGLFGHSLCFVSPGRGEIKESANGRCAIRALIHALSISGSLDEGRWCGL